MIGTIRTTAPASLSVVIPTHNTSALTLRCLDALARESPDGLPEIVVVDDGSTDDTIAVLRQRHPATTMLSNPLPLGFSAAANRGLRAAGGDLLLLLNSDTELLPGALRALQSAFAAAPEIGVGGAQLYFPDRRPQWSGGREPSLLWLFGLASGLPPLLARLRSAPATAPAPAEREVDWVTGAALAMRREVWERCGPLDEGFRFYAQDLDLCRRAAAAGWRVCILRDFGVLHHHGASIGDRAGSVERQHPELLWADLLRWAAQARGERWAQRARKALLLGASLRLAARRLLSIVLPAARRPAHRQATAAYAAARRALHTAARGAPARARSRNPS